MGTQRGGEEPASRENLRLRLSNVSATAVQVRERKKESVESDEESGDRRWGERRVLWWGEGLSPEISSTGSGLTARTGLLRGRRGAGTLL